MTLKSPRHLWLALFAVALLLSVSLVYAELGHVQTPSPTQVEPGALDPFAAPAARATLWLVLLALLAFAWLALGRAFAGTWRAIFISRANRMPLSQTQFVAWTLLFASAVLALFLINLRGPGSDPLAFAIPTEAGGLLGLSAVSFGGAAVVQSVKRNQDPSSSAKARIVRKIAPKEGPLVARLTSLPEEQKHAVTRVATAVRKGTINGGIDGLAGTEAGDGVVVDKVIADMSDGLLARNASPRDANPLNFLQGDELGNQDDMDLGKIQLLAFSLITFVAYVVLLWQLFTSGVYYAANDLGGFLPHLDRLPQVSQGLLAIVGASHLGYLGSKAGGATRAA